MNNQKILLIDYDPASISKTATPLTKAGYTVEVAKDGLSGLAAFERTKPALVLVEAMLPRKHGFEVCQEIKAKPDGKSTPVLITSAVCRGRKYRMDALQIYGCDEYIEKPIPDQELVTLIGKLIDQAAQATEEVKQDLSKAIDKASASDGPAAIESMSDDELEAKIDSLLMGGETDDPFPAPVATVTSVETETPPAPSAEPVANVAAGTDVSDADTEMQVLTTSDHEPVEPGDVAEPEFDTESEMERRVEAMVQVEPLPPALDEDDPFEASTEAVDAAPDAGAATAVASEPAVAEWTETATPKRGGSKPILVGLAAVIVLGAVGFLAFRQGWIGGGAETSEAVLAATAEPLNEPVTIDNAKLDPAPGARDAVADSPPVERPPEPPNGPADQARQPEQVEVAGQAAKPDLPPEPEEFQGRSSAEINAAARRQRDAERAMVAAAGSLKSTLLSDGLGEPGDATLTPVEPVNLEDDLIGTPVAPRPVVGQLFDINDVDVAPQRKEFAQPVYDPLARRMGQEGEILVSVLIDETGHVMSVELVKPIPNSRLNNSTVNAATDWVYEPAVKDGVKVSVWKTERILFKLD